MLRILLYLKKKREYLSDKLCKTFNCNEPQQTGELVAHQHYNLILIPSLLPPSTTIQQQKGKAFSCSASAFAH